MFKNWLLSVLLLGFTSLYEVHGLDCAYGQIHTSDRCFQQSVANMSWIHAQTFCRGMGGDIITLNSDLMDVFDEYGYIWIGMYEDDVVANLWSWSGGSAVTYTNWAASEPQVSVDVLCGVMVGGLMYSIDCGVNHSVICEYCPTGQYYSAGTCLSYPTAVPTSSPTSTPTVTPSLFPTRPTVKPTATPTVIPTTTPTELPTVNPTREPTVKPTRKPTATPSVRPSRPTCTPTRLPTRTPSRKPTAHPTFAPGFAQNCGSGDWLSDRCMIKIGSTKNWDDALEYCDSNYANGGRLVTILDEDTYDDVMSIVGNVNVWIGAIWDCTYEHDDTLVPPDRMCQWEWQSGDLTSPYYYPETYFADWEGGSEPDHHHHQDTPNGNDCVRIGPNGWADTDCDETKRFVCEWCPANMDFDHDRCV